MNTTIKFAKVHPEAKIPSKRDEDMGYDIYACFEEKEMIIPPFTSKLIPTGIATACDKEWGIVFRERGSTGVKNLKINAGVIDSGFRGEHFVCLYNGNNKPMCITKNEMPDGSRANPYMIYYPYSKAIAQMLVLPVPKVTIKEVSYEELKNIESERGDGALGSSNK